MNFADYMGKLPLENGTQLLLDCIKEGMSPFRGAWVNVYDEYDIDSNTHWIVAEVRLTNGARIAHMEPINDWKLQDDPAKEVLRISNLMLTAFRHRDGEPITDKIVLGEN